MNKPNKSKSEISSKQKLIFKIITIVIPVFLLLSFEGVLRLAGYGDNLNLFITNPTDGYEEYLMVNQKVGKKYFQKFEYTAPANDIFLKKKSEEAFRIFVMGSSTVYGFPYERNLMFSRILNHQLNEAYPDRQIEVINTAITAINSYTLLDYIDQILEHKPDAILIYAGHNEFYGAFGVGSNETMGSNRKLTQLHLSLMDYRVYQLLKNGIAGVSQKIAGSSKKKTHGTLMKRIVAKTDILLNSPEYDIAMNGYKLNMGDLLAKTKQAGVPVFYSEMVSNIKGLEPFNSIASDTLMAAIDVFKQAQLAEKNGDFETALQLYYSAKDLDCIRFRASEDINKIINDLINEYKVNKVPMLASFQNASPNKLIGDNLMTEHVHPNIEGNFIMANTFFSEIKKSGILGEPNKYYNNELQYLKRNWGYTALDSLMAHHNVQLLKGFWPFVNDAKKEVDYRLFYKPNSYIDSIAFQALVKKELILADVRLELAQKYEKNGQTIEAYKEYEALLRTNPYIAVNYRDAANCLIKLQDLPLALTYFKKSLEYENSFFATFKIAEISLIMADYDSAIRYFEKAYNLAPNEKKVNVFAKAYMAFVYANKLDKAKIVADELKKANASQFLKIPPKTYGFNQYIPFKTKNQVEQAKQLIVQNKYHEALIVLEQSLNIYDSHIANRLIGEIYLKEQNMEQADFYFNKVNKWFKFDPDFLYDFALIYLAKKDYVNANNCLQEIAIINPEYKNLEQLRLLLS